MVNDTQKNCGWCCGGCLCVLAFIGLVIMLPLSFSILDPTEYGLLTNTVTKTVDFEKVYGAGRYFTGITYNFVRFPSTLQIIDFSPDADSGGPSLTAGTLDKQSVVLEVTLYYRLVRKDVPALYREFGAEGYASVLTQRASSSLKNAAVKFSTTEYFTDRTRIAEYFLNEVANQLHEAHVVVELLMLRGLGLPAALEAVVVSKVVEEQRRATAELQQQVSKIAADTEVIDALAEGNVTRVSGQANATGSFIVTRARAEGAKKVVAVEETAYRLLREDLNLTAPQLMRFLWASRSIKHSKPGDRLVVGFENSGNLLVNVG